MKVTYDQTADALYIYFTEIGVGGVEETKTFERLTLDLDARGQIISMGLYASEALRMGNGLSYALRHPEASFGGETLRLTFDSSEVTSSTIEWEANVDLDDGGQILGVEILFGRDFAASRRLSHLQPRLL